MISPVPDVKKLTIDPEKDSFVLLACDGIWNSLSSQETVDFVNDRLKKSAKHDTNYLTNIIKEVSNVFVCQNSETLLTLFLPGEGGISPYMNVT